VVVAFVSYDNGPSLKLLGQLKQVNAKYSARGVAIFAVHVKLGAGRAEELAQRMSLPFTLHADSDGRTAERFGLMPGQVPVVRVLNRNGEIRAFEVNERVIEDLLLE